MPTQVSGVLSLLLPSWTLYQVSQSGFGWWKISKFASEEDTLKAKPHIIFKSRLLCSVDMADRVTFFQAEVFGRPGVSCCPALDPHLALPLILLGNVTSLSSDPVSSCSFCTPITFLKHQWLFQTCTCLKALTLVKFSLQGTPFSQYSCVWVSPYLCLNSNITSSKRPPGIPCPRLSPPCHPLFYFLSGIYHGLRVLFIGQANSTCAQHKRRKRKNQS